MDKPASPCASAVAKELKKSWHTLTKDEQKNIELMCQAKMEPAAIAAEIKRQRLVAELLGHAKDQDFTMNPSELAEAMKDHATGTAAHVAVSKIKAKQSES